MVTALEKTEKEDKALPLDEIPYLINRHLKKRFYLYLKHSKRRKDKKEFFHPLVYSPTGYKPNFF